MDVFTFWITVAMFLSLHVIQAIFYKLTTKEIVKRFKNIENKLEKQKGE